MYRQHRYDTQTFVIYMDAYDRGSAQGRYENPVLGESGVFHCLSQLMLKLDACLDLGGEPQAFQTVRSFSGATGLWPEGTGTVSSRRGRVATFVLAVRYRRNASWQGTLRWTDRNQVRHFRSVLELMALINSALAENQALAPNGCSLAEAE